MTTNSIRHASTRWTGVCMCSLSSQTYWGATVCCLLGLLLFFLLSVMVAALLRSQWPVLRLPDDDSALNIKSSGCFLGMLQTLLFRKNTKIQNRNPWQHFVHCCVISLSPSKSSFNLYIASPCYFYFRLLKKILVMSLGKVVNVSYVPSDLLSIYI